MEKLGRAVQQNNRKKVSAAIEALPSIKLINEVTSGKTLLYYAARNNLLSSLEVLLENGANTSIREESMNSTPLHGAAYGGHLDAVKLLLCYGANPFALNNANDTPEDDGQTEEIKQIIREAKTKRNPVPRELLVHTGNKLRDIPEVIINPGGTTKVRVVCLSDTHNFRSFDISAVPPGDILVHSGDFTDRGTKEEHKSFLKFLKNAPHKHKIVVAGNHDFGLDELSCCAGKKFFKDTCIYLRDEAATVMGIKFYGTPWTPIGMAFHARGEPLDAQFDRIPEEIDILVTHSPPYNVLDLAWVRPTPFNQETSKCKECGVSHPQYYVHWGVKSLKNRVLQVQPKVHQFGHVHDDGHAVHSIPGIPTLFINAAVDLKGKPIVYDCIV